MNKSERFWDRTASNYDQIEMKDNQTSIDILQRTKTHLRKSDVVLDFGCGTGRITNELAAYVKEIRAIDISSKMIAIAEEKAIARNITNITYARSTLFDESLKNGSFDVILVFHVLHVLEDEHHAMQRMNELLKPGGLLVSATPCVGEKGVLKHLLSVAGRVGLVPEIKPFQIRNLIATFVKGNFSIVETECLKKSSQEYFIVARKT